MFELDLVTRVSVLPHSLAAVIFCLSGVIFPSKCVFLDVNARTASKALLLAHKFVLRKIALIMGI